MTPFKTIDYPFTEAECREAFEQWGANCGPTALAFALQIPLAQVRGTIPGFEEKRYTSPTMMILAVSNLHRRVEVAEPIPGVKRLDPHRWQNLSLVRVQWTGPWTKPGMNPKWAYNYTHWIATWMSGDVPMIFDINGGILTFEEWKAEIVPALTAATPRADGGWFPTHVWRIDE